jgi:hypothetical protein
MYSLVIYLAAVLDANNAFHHVLRDPAGSDLYSSVTSSLPGFIAEVPYPGTSQIAAGAWKVSVYDVSVS